MPLYVTSPARGGGDPAPGTLQVLLFAVIPHSEPLLQAVPNPFGEEFDVVNVDYDREEPQPEPTIDGDGSTKELAELSLDPDDPFEPEAEVDIGSDFLPSINPLASVPAFPVSHVPVRSISQTLELLEQGAHLYVCGDAKRMAKDVDQALHDAVETHGNLSKEAATDYVSAMKKAKRYQRDVY